MPRAQGLDPPGGPRRSAGAYEQRLEKALQRIQASKPWSKPKRDRLQRSTNQSQSLLIVERATLDAAALIGRRGAEAGDGGFGKGERAGRMGSKDGAMKPQEQPVRAAAWNNRIW